MEFVLYSLLTAATLLAILVIIRTLLFTPYKQTAVKEVPITLDREKIVGDMVDMIRCKTVSYRDEALVDYAEFEKFETLLRERFPRIFAAAAFRKIGKTGLLFHLKGESDAAPTVLMAHYDVVPADEENWTRPAFDGLIEEDVIWGRGTLDTKGSLCGIVQALEAALADGYCPKNDVYLSFSGEEEVDGDSCRDIVTYLQQNGIRPALVLDEGGAVVDNVFPGVKGSCALIGIAEKGTVSMDLSLKSAGGHASTPPKRTVMGKLCDAVVNIEKHPFPRHLTPAVAQMFDTLGRHSTFLYRMIFANLWLFLPLLDMICNLSGGELNAMMRTTVATTRMQGSDAYNVLPPEAKAGINVRLMEGDTTESAIAYLKRVVKNEDIVITPINDGAPSICSRTDCDAYETVSEAIRQTWADTLVSPYLMMAASDSRHYCRISDRVYRFSPMHLSKEERGMIHGNDERIPIATLLKTVEFYARLLKMI